MDGTRSGTAGVYSVCVVVDVLVWPNFGSWYQGVHIVLGAVGQLVSWLTHGTILQAHRVDL